MRVCSFFFVGTNNCYRNKRRMHFLTQKFQSKCNNLSVQERALKRWWYLFFYLNIFFFHCKMQFEFWFQRERLLKLLYGEQVFSMHILLVFSYWIDKIQDFVDLGILTFQEKRSCREKHWHRSSLFELFIQNYAYFFNTRKNPDYFFFFYVSALDSGKF